ncbi:serine/threonine-protein kinase [Nonomuraea typhae]|uniref:serine/threonine-protein kinase n=1 Tax=Nonomuraea typhae TaxID=2603600 RepID=UPI0012FCA6B7|nr:serine/threonine-protein kinase [Nonomuraea typhae]
MPEQHTRLLAERYELIAPLGRGTMGTVWRAHDRALGREVAVKEIRQDPGLTEEQRAELRERMVREGRTASRINHPSVAAIHDVIIDGDSPWIIMELIAARSLEQVIDEEGPLPPRLVAEIGVDLLGALRAAHAQGITHRDVKPGNVLVSSGGRVVLTDFGIAKQEGDSRLTKTGMVIGSPGYTAPERARGEYTGPESDIWSLGATLYFAVEGRPAYERASIAETLAALLSENADPPTQAGPLRPVLTGLLNKDYKQRLSAAQAETMLRMVADTPTSEIPIVKDDTRQPNQAGRPGPHPGGQPDGRLGPGQRGGQPGPGQAPRPPRPQEGYDPDRTIAVRLPKPPHASPQAGGPVGVPGQPIGANGPAAGAGAPGQALGAPGQPGGAPGQPVGAPGQPGGAPGHPVGAPGRPVEAPGQPVGAPGQPVGASGQAHGAPGPTTMPGAAAPGQGTPGSPGIGAFAAAPPSTDGDRRNTGAFADPPGQPGGFPPAPGGNRPPVDEGDVHTMRVAVPPGQRVYPPHPRPQQPPMPPNPPQQQPGTPQVYEEKGLGTDLFAIAGTAEEPPQVGNKKGMLMLMAVAAAAAVIIAILIVAFVS